MMEKKEITIYTDGACSGNPGKGGCACVLLFTDRKGTVHEKEMSRGYRRTTNNRMELMGVIMALEALNQPCRISLFTDSQYIVNAFNSHWVDKWERLDWHRDSKKKESVKNTDLWKKLMKAAQAHDITYSWVKGHQNNPYNERCDSLAVAAYQKEESQLEEDNGYEAS